MAPFHYSATKANAPADPYALWLAVATTSNRQPVNRGALAWRLHKASTALAVFLVCGAAAKKGTSFSLLMSPQRCPLQHGRVHPRQVVCAAAYCVRVSGVQPAHFSVRCGREQPLCRHCGGDYCTLTTTGTRTFMILTGAMRLSDELLSTCENVRSTRAHSGCAPRSRSNSFCCVSVEKPWGYDCSVCTIRAEIKRMYTLRLLLPP
jgi:hypothetical protein